MSRTIYRENIVRMVAGTLVVTGVALSLAHSRWWPILPAFVGLNLFQSALTSFCPLEIILAKCGVKTPLEEYQARDSGAD